MPMIVENFRMTDNGLEDMRQLWDAVVALFVHDLVRVFDGPSEVLGLQPSQKCGDEQIQR